MLYWVKICFGENEREQYVVADEIELFLIFLLHGKVVTDEALITDYRQTFEDRYLLYKQGIESKESSDFSDTYKKMLTCKDPRYTTYQNLYFPLKFHIVLENYRSFKEQIFNFELNASEAVDVLGYMLTIHTFHNNEEVSISQINMEEIFCGHSIEFQNRLPERSHFNQQE
ncbi:hypothetical protein MFLO_07182 [Listeria floridensis FSL S10-1187]|uniref:Uncharacterized protein n=1 Tax=Listeria floridensis FSL S10-1187 TaxID=1265817 RepID=A0ABP3B0Q6_9LIST|nr:hypothetical protein [Listeria floridensis]EUJ32307.1 hypothetical protein MFLO_07182 [Listeria floridensis FSL S10-1187]